MMRLLSDQLLQFGRLRSSEAGPHSALVGRESIGGLSGAIEATMECWGSAVYPALGKPCV